MPKTENLYSCLALLGILLLVLLITRELLCWYWKINERVATLNRIHETQEAIAAKLDEILTTITALSNRE